MVQTKSLTFILATFFLLSLSRNAAFGQITFEANAGIGATGVDIDAWTYNTANDWGLLMGLASAAVYPLKLGKISIGAEFYFHHFFWYNYIPYGYSYTSEVEINAFGPMALVRYDITDNLFVDAGAGAHIFKEFTDFGVMVSVGYKIKLGEKLYIPIKIRTERVFDEDAALYPVGLNIGIGYTL